MDLPASSGPAPGGLGGRPVSLPISIRVADTGEGVPAAAADKQLDKDAGGQRLLQACPDLVPPCCSLLLCFLIASCSPWGHTECLGKGAWCPLKPLAWASFANGDERDGERGTGAGVWHFRIN